MKIKHALGTRSPAIPLLALLLVAFLAAMAWMAWRGRPRPADLTGWRTDTSHRLIELTDMVRGCPRRDCIPSIDDPRFVDVAEGDAWMDDRAPVTVLLGETEARAYPLHILTRHEIVNDVFEGRPVAVTYCPLWNSAVTFVRELDGEAVEFGVSGFLRTRNLVMYDRWEENLWSQIAGEAVVGARVGDRLELVSSTVMSWRDFKAVAPEGRVLVGVERRGRNYDLMQYAGYDPGRGGLGRGLQRLLDGEALAKMDHVVALDLQGEGVAVPLEVLRERRVVAVEAGGREVVVLWAPGTANILDAATVAESRDLGASAAFVAKVDGRALTLEAAVGSAAVGSAEAGAAEAGQLLGSRFVDAETGSTWTVAGVAVAGPLEGRRMEPLPYTDAFWFGWHAFRPETRVVR